MSKPDDIPQDVWSVACKIADTDCGCAPGRTRANGTSHSDSCWKHAECIARAILAAKAEEREAILQFEFDLPIRMYGADMMIDIREYIRKRGEA